MRNIKLTGREVTVLRAIGFAEAVSGADIADHTRMEAEDIADAINGLMSAGFLESVPYSEHVTTAELTQTAFEVNPGYVAQLRTAMLRR
jgi:DNA-binding MarR family transcriptional regulator